ncbi:MAG: hypothetical protein MSH60_09775 [Ruminococcus sp.]|nr:hypothetical protein [Ruminococcus sp.]
MANSINNYGIDGIGVYDKYSNKLINSDEKKSSTLGQSDFLKLIVEQMKNQDFNNTTDNNEFIAQMAQFSSLEAMQNLTNYSNLSYGTSLVGKYVTVKTGDEDYVTGLVDCVAVDGGKYSLVINGKEYPSSGVVEVITKDVFDRLQQENAGNTEESDVTEPTQANASADASVQARIDKLMEEYEKATSELYAELQKSIEEIKAEVYTDESPVMTEATVNAYNYAGTRVDVVQSNVRSSAPDSYSVSTSNAAAGISGSANVNSTGVTEDYQLCLRRKQETGTRMAAPQYIFNTSITGKIDTSTVLGKTESGRAFTDIGFSGVGRLGEVVTWADGTQRVEVISPYGYSVYFTTSGEHTLDEICNFDCAPGQYAGVFNGNELAIRYYSRAYTAAEKEAMERFENSISQMNIIKNTEV